MLRVNMHAWYLSNNPVAQPFHVSVGLQTKISPSQLPAWIPRRHWLEGAWHRSCLGEIDLHFDWNMMIFDCKELLVQTASLASCTMPARQHWQWVQRRFRFQVQTLLKRLPLIWCCCFPSPTNVCKMFVASQVKRSWRRFFPKMVSKRMVRFDGSFLKSRSPWATWKMTRSGCDNCFSSFQFFLFRSCVFLAGERDCWIHHGFWRREDDWRQEGTRCRGWISWMLAKTLARGRGHVSWPL